MEQEHGRASKVAAYPAFVGPELLDDLCIPIPSIDCHAILLWGRGGNPRAAGPDDI
jgi:hypothetical protein